MVRYYFDVGVLIDRVYTFEVDVPFFDGIQKVSDRVVFGFFSFSNHYDYDD